MLDNSGQAKHQGWQRAAQIIIIVVIMVIIVIASCLHALAPQPARDAAQVALHNADHVHVLNAGATVVVDNRGQAKEQG
jgi:uncharacterized protein YpmB